MRQLTNTICSGGRLYINITDLNKPMNESSIQSICESHTFNYLFQIYMHPYVSRLMSLVNIYQHYNMHMLSVCVLIETAH